MRQLALVAVRALGEAGGSQEVVAAALGGALLGVAPFRIRHGNILSIARIRRERGRRSRNLVLVLNLELISQTRQRIPSRIRRCLFAGACCEVPVLTAARAEALAVRLAEGSGGQGEQHLLAHDVPEQKTALFIITDFGLVRGNCVLAGTGVDPEGAEDEVEIPLQGLRDRLYTPRAEDLEVALVMRAKADVLNLRVRPALLAAMLDDQVGLTLYRQRRDLPYVIAVVEDSGSEGLVDLEGLVEELYGSNEHELRVGLWRGGGQMQHIYSLGSS
jgi:hypothetical protein